MLISAIRKWIDLSSSEKADIICKMFSIQNLWERDKIRKSLAEKYRISEWTITSFIAHETMRRLRSWKWNQRDSQEWNVTIIRTKEEWIDENLTQWVQESTQNRVYTITTLSELTEEMRENILEEFWDIIRTSANDSVYDYYKDIEAISEYYNIEPSILEQFLKNRYSWLWAKLEELKKWRTLREEDKINIRLYVEQWVSEEDKKERRKEMAQKYWVSTYVIWAITAWKFTENRWVVLKKDTFSDKMEVEILLKSEWTQEVPEITISKEELWQQVWNSMNKGIPVGQPSQLEAKEISNHQIPETLTEVIDEWELIFTEEDKIFICEFAQEFDFNSSEQRLIFLQDIFDLFPDATIDDIKNIIPDFPDDTVHTNTKRSWEWMWALVNYNNEVKNKWRQKLKEFIDENTEKEKRKDMKVLCLPWIECLEIPLYLELGFKPENIVWVEAWIVKWKKDIELIEKFQVNAKKYWIQTRIGKLEKILGTEDTAFDIVSLDFLGPFWDSALRILSQLKVTEEVIVMVNTLWKRESSFDSTLIKAYQSGRQKPLSIETQSIKWSYTATIRWAIDTLVSNVEENYINNNFPELVLDTGRNWHWLFQILRKIPINMKKHLPDELNTLYNIINQNAPEYCININEFDGSRFFDNVLWETIEKFLNQYKLWSISSNLTAWGAVLHLHSIFCDMLTPLSWSFYNQKKWRSIKKYKYYSRHGRVKTPFISDFIHFWIPIQEYRELLFKERYVIKFLRLIVTDILLGEWWQLYIFDKSGVARSTGTVIARSDNLIYVWKDIRVEIQIGKIIPIWINPHRHTFSDFLSKFQDFENEARIEII
jgi:predicted house-cleaning noncanonical NTP pyrophosphatase (MazG superfamily)